MWGEVAAGAVSVRSNEVITAVKCDLRRELVWVGCESGYLFVMHRQVGQMVRYSSWRAHPNRIVGLLPLGSHMLSLAQNRVAMHSAGGLVQFARPTKENLHIACGQLEAGQGLTRLLLGGLADQAGVVASFDLAAHEEVARWDVGESSPVIALRGPVSRGMTALATANGQLCVVDPRVKMAVVNKLAAHVGGIRSMDARGDMIATTGYHGTRMGEMVADNMVKVFDVRVALRPVLTLPAVSPRVVQFQPRRPSALMVACNGGIVTFVDVQDASSLETYQLGVGGYGGAPITAVDISASGDIAVLGCQGGSLHVWSSSPQASMNLASDPVDIVPLYPSHRRRPLSEQDSFASLPQYYSHDPHLLSELEPGTLIDVGLPPHVVDPSLIKDMNQKDFVGYVSNPFYSRGMPPLAATRGVAPLRNARLKLHTPTKKGQEALKAERALARAAAGGTVLPMRYHRMEIKVQTGVKFEEFDFSYYNRTCFAGLENGLRNCYVNSLLQVLYFVPMFRKHILSHPPEPDVEFCLTCEMSFLFRMLRGSNATPCQAANLLRTLKQIPEATALGLLEGSNGPGNDNPQTSSLPRLLAFLTRFLLDHLNKENGGAQGAQARASQPSPGTSDYPSGMDTIFGLRYRQRVQCSDSDLPEKIREASNFQVDLVVPTGETPSSWPPTPEHNIRSVRPGRADMVRDNAPLTPPGTTRTNKSSVPAPWDGRPRSAGDIWTSSLSLSSSPYPPPPFRPTPPLSQSPATAPTPATSSRSSHSSHPSPALKPSEPVPPSSEENTPRHSLDSATAQHAQRSFRPDPLDLAAQLQGLPVTLPPSPGHTFFPTNTTPGHTPMQSPMGRWSQGGKSRGSGEGSQQGQGPSIQTFSELLQSSLQQSTETRAWFQETRSYHAVRQSRVPLKMPQVLVVNCSNADPSQLKRWLDGPTNDPLRPSWLPPAIAIESSPADWQVVVEEADSASELQQEPAPGSFRVVYELTAVVCHVLDADDVSDPSGNAPTGHLIAHIRVLPPFVSEQQELEAVWTRPHRHTLASFNVPVMPVRHRTPVAIHPPVAPLVAAQQLPATATHAPAGPIPLPAVRETSTLVTEASTLVTEASALVTEASSLVADSEVYHGVTATGCDEATVVVVDSQAIGTGVDIRTDRATLNHCAESVSAGRHVGESSNGDTAVLGDTNDTVVLGGGLLQPENAASSSAQLEIASSSVQPEVSGTLASHTENAATSSAQLEDATTSSARHESATPSLLQSENAATSSTQAQSAVDAAVVAGETGGTTTQIDVKSLSQPQSSESRVAEDGSYEEPLLTVRRSRESLPTTLTPCSEPQMNPASTTQGKPLSGENNSTTAGSDTIRDGIDQNKAGTQPDNITHITDPTGTVASRAVNSGVASVRCNHVGRGDTVDTGNQNSSNEHGDMGLVSEQKAKSETLGHPHLLPLSHEPHGTQDHVQSQPSLQAVPYISAPPESNSQPHPTTYTQSTTQPLNMFPHQTPLTASTPTHTSIQSSQPVTPQSSMHTTPYSGALQPASQAHSTDSTPIAHNPLQSSMHTTPYSGASQPVSQAHSTDSTPLGHNPSLVSSQTTSQPGSAAQSGCSWNPLPSPASAYAMSSAINAVLTTPSSKGQGVCSEWLVFNDFCIAPCPYQEVMDHFDGQKLPVLLFYSQLEELQAAEEAPLSAPVPVLTQELFHQLCHAEPLQGASARITPRPITPFDVHSNPPHPGMLLALDAEFVALSAPQVQVSSDGSEVQVRQSRLGLARVSVLYGEGELEGVPCIDDYIRTLEPVYDYLTRFSGLAPGDLDPSSSPHPLCTLKAAYLKLRYLVDCGCVFVGHGLKKDFRTINIVVPPSQIIDTVELYSFRKHRKLSLRFLASYMLGVNIQEETHDSVEDARTALQLYRLYQQLEAEGRVMEVLTGIYQWGKQYGWEPVNRSGNNGTSAVPLPSPSTFVPPALHPRAAA